MLKQNLELVQEYCDIALAFVSQDKILQNVLMEYKLLELDIFLL